MKLFNKSGKSRGGVVHINVTALVDMMTVLVIFLVMQFNATGEMLFISKDMLMSRAENARDLTRVPILSIDAKGSVFYEGVIIAEALKPTQGTEDPVVQPLADKLEDNRRRFEALNARHGIPTGGVDDPTAAVNVQVDKNLDFSIVKRVLFTCEKAGYNRIRLAVNLDAPAMKPKEVKL
jgi:biopolymer transport protein ExbD